MSEVSDGPLYSDKQAAAILRRAVERAGAGSATGISLTEMERIASEIGIDPQHVRAAAAEVSGGAASSAGMIDLERIVSAELSEEAWEAVLGELRRLFGDAGSASVVGQAREWNLRNDKANVHASLVSRNGSTKVHLMENHSDTITVGWSMWAIFSLLGAMIAGVAGAKAGGLDQAMLNVLITSGVSGAVFLVIRTSIQNWRGRQRQRLEGLLHRVAGLVEEHRPHAAMPATDEVMLPDRSYVKPVVADDVQQVVGGSFQ